MNWCGRLISSERGANCHVSTAGLKTGATGGSERTADASSQRPRRGTAFAVAIVTNDYFAHTAAMGGWRGYSEKSFGCEGEVAVAGVRDSRGERRAMPTTPRTFISARAERGMNMRRLL